MKIDTEGFEVLAMMGMKNFMQNYPPKIIFTELSHRMVISSAKLGYSDEEARKMPQLYKDTFSKYGSKIVSSVDVDVDLLDITLRRNV